jgi:hypothetical protein
MNRAKVWFDKTAYDLADVMNRMDEASLTYEEYVKAAKLYLLARIALKGSQIDLFRKYESEQIAEEVSMMTESTAPQSEPKEPSHEGNNEA